MLGLDPETDPTGDNAFNYVAPVYLEKANQDLEQAMQEGGFDTTRYDLKRADGTEFPAEISSHVLRDITGAPVGLVGIMRDITERQRIEQERLQNVENMVGAMKATISAVAMTMEKRDPYTAGHQRRVAQLAVAMGRAIGLTEDRIEGLQMTALVHDIGKIMVPTEILSKPTGLSNAEYELIKTHPQIAYDILKDIKFPWPLAQTVLQHHERVDGSGYPYGLKGSDIIPEARLLAVADVVEAMASHRPYRPAVGLKEALNEIRGKRGIIYDSDAVDACIHVFTEEDFTWSEDDE
jgi:PAS domain S-box-containing protein